MMYKARAIMEHNSQKSEKKRLSNAKGQRSAKREQKVAKSEIDFSKLAHLLKIPQTHDLHAHVAGGYLRDVILGRTPKDIDIFIHHTAFNDVNRDLINQGFVITRVIDPDRFRSNPAICCGADYKSPEGRLINLIGLSCR